MKYAAKISYLGTAFSGWQAQGRGRGIQPVVEEGLSKLAGGARVGVVAAGRTDAGVHAMGQVISFELPRLWEPELLRRAMDANLPPEVRILDVSPVSESFDARHSARWREYVYFLWAESCTIPHIAGMSWKIHKPWDWENVRKAAALLEGKHDFAAFCRASDRPEKTMRTIMFARLAHSGSLWRFRIRGRSFLTNMVRIIVGSLGEIGRGRRDVAWFASLLKGANREEAGLTAPAEGLFFWKVGYDSASGPLWRSHRGAIVTSGLSQTTDEREDSILGR